MGANERASAARPGAGGAGTARVMHARGDRRRQPAGEGRGAMRAGAGSRSREQEQVPPGGRSAPAAPLPPAPAPLPPGAPQQRAVNPLCSRGCVLPQSRALRSLGGTDHIDLIAGFALGRPFRSVFFFFLFFSLFFFFFKDGKEGKWQREETISVVSEGREVAGKASVLGAWGRQITSVLGMFPKNTAGETFCDKVIYLRLLFGDKVYVY